MDSLFTLIFSFTSHATRSPLKNTFKVQTIVFHRNRRNMHFDAISLSSVGLILAIIVAHFSTSSSSSLDYFIYAGCSQQKYTPESAYDTNVNSILSSFTNSAAFTNFNSFNTSSVQGNSKNDVVYGLYQCRGDLSNSACQDCVSSAVGRISTTCGGACGGAVQLEGCYVRYDNVKFLGVEDKTVVSDKCGPLIGDNPDLLSRTDSVLAQLEVEGQYFRVAGDGDHVQGVAQCVQDLSVSECQDCLSDAIQRLRSQCGSSAWGDMFLAKCYARYSEREYHASPTPNNENNDDVEKALAILIGLVAAVAVLVVFLSFFSKLVDRKAHGGGK